MPHSLSFELIYIYLPFKRKIQFYLIGERNFMYT